MKTANEVIEKKFSEIQVSIIKATLAGRGWGSADFELQNGKTIYGFGYPTQDAKETIKSITPRQIAGHYSAISKIIKDNDFDFIQHIPDYWGEGKTSDGMLFIPYNLYPELEKWAIK